MALLSKSAIWKEIDLCESYLVCCMFEKAASLASSVVQHICTASSMEAIDGTQLAEMMEAAGMVFIQSLKELGRTRELFVELEMLFGSVAAIPVQVFLTGACMQISEGYSSNLREIFEEFLGKYMGGEVFCLPKAEQQGSSSEGCIQQSVMGVENYLEVAEVYAITLLGMILRKPDVAISWTERAALPEEKRQDMLRRLRSLHAADSSSSASSRTVQTADGIGDLSASGTGSAVSMGESFPRTATPQSHPNGDEKSKPAILKSIHPSIERISDRIVRLKFGNFWLVLPSGKIMLLSSLMLFTFYILRKRSAVLKRVVARQASSIRRALVDAWRLAFSVQMNPLAAVQQLPSAASRGSH